MTLSTKNRNAAKIAEKIIIRIVDRTTVSRFGQIILNHSRRTFLTYRSIFLIHKL
jgi:hypothetical protein